MAARLFVGVIKNLLWGVSIKDYSLWSSLLRGVAGIVKIVIVHLTLKYMQWSHHLITNRYSMNYLLLRNIQKIFHVFYNFESVSDRFVDLPGKVLRASFLTMKNLPCK